MSINQCKSDIYILKAPNDTTLIVVNPDNSERLIKNRTGLKSKYFALWTNEKCEILLEYGMVAFKMQNNSFIDMNKVYGFKDIPTSMAPTDLGILTILFF